MVGSSIRYIALGVVVVALAVGAFGQGGATGAITGTVQDPSGAVVANADVRITNQDTNVLERTVASGPDGVFTATLLPVGTYTVSVHASGFADATFTNITVRVTETPTEGQGKRQRVVPLAQADAEELQELARRVTAAGDQIDDRSAGVDGGTTQLRVDDGQASSRVEIREGWDTGAEVWDLLDAVERVTPKG